jgi:hypothetical protein
MQSVVVLFSARFEEWVRPASPLWLAAEAPVDGAPWFILSTDRITSEQVAAEVVRIATQVINTNADWQILAVVDEASFQWSHGLDSAPVFPLGTTAWIDRLQALPNRPRRVTFFAVHDAEPRNAMPERTTSIIMTATLDVVTGLINSRTPRGGRATDVVIVTAPQLMALDSIVRKVLAVNVVLFLARHPDALPRDFRIGKLLLPDPTLAGPNGSQVDLAALGHAVLGMRQSVDQYLSDLQRETPVEIYPIAAPIDTWTPAFEAVEAPEPRIHRLSWVTVRDPEVTSRTMERAWWDGVVRELPEKLVTQMSSSFTAERKSLDELRREARTQPGPRAGGNPGADVRATRKRREQLDDLMRGYADQTERADLRNGPLPPNEFPEPATWRDALTRFRSAAASRVPLKAFISVNVVLVLAIALMNWSFPEFASIAHLFASLGLLNLFIILRIGSRVQRAGRELEQLRIQSNEYLRSLWNSYKQGLETKSTYFAASVNLRHVAQARVESKVFALAQEEARAWLEDTLSPTLTRLYVAMAIDLPPLPYVASKQIRVRHDEPMFRQEFSHLHRYRPEGQLRPALIRVRGIDSLERYIDADPLLFSLTKLEFRTPDDGFVAGEIEDEDDTPAAEIDASPAETE